MGDFDDVITNLMKAKTLWNCRWTESITFAWGTLYGNFLIPCLQLCRNIRDYSFLWHLSLLIVIRKSMVVKEGWYIKWVHWEKEKNAIKWMREQQALIKLTNTGNIARKEESNKQEQIRETVLDYMLPPSQLSVSTSTICLGMRHDHKQYVDKLLRPPLSNALG